MAIYNVRGEQIYNVYSFDGTPLQQAYNIDGVPLLDTSATKLTLMQYNVGQWFTGSGSGMSASYYPTYSALHHQIIEANKPDIVAFEEYIDPVISGNSVMDMLGDLLPNRVVGSGSTPYQKKAIYTPTLQLNEAVNGSLAWGNYVRSSVEIDAKTIHLFVVHWSNTASTRAQDAKTIFDMVKDLEYVIILGDINTTCMSVTDSDYINVMKQYVDAGFHCANCSEEFGFFNTWFAGHNFQVVDYESRGAPNDCIFTSPKIVMNEVYRDEHKIPVCEELETRLDHAPLIAKVTIY